VGLLPRYNSSRYWAEERHAPGKIDNLALLKFTYDYVMQKSFLNYLQYVLYEMPVV
jgi:hypothetical protein